MKLYIDMYLEGLSLPEIGKKTGKSMSAIRYHLKKAGVLRTRSEALQLASKQGKLGAHARGKKVVFSESWCANISKGRKNWSENHAKGISIGKKGYAIYTKGENKHRSVHVVLMESIIGRKLNKGECVHHIDGNKANNNVNNLAFMSVSAHARLHRYEDEISKNKRERNKDGQFC